MTITHPNPSDNQVISSSMLQPGHFSANRENAKRSKYGQAAVILGAKCIPLVLETYGNFGSAFSSFIGKLSVELFRSQSNLAPELETHFKNRLKQRWTTRISVCLQRANAQLIISKIIRTQQVTQRGAPTTKVDFSGASLWSI